MRIFATEFTDKGHSYYQIGDTDFTVDFSGGTRYFDAKSSLNLAKIIDNIPIITDS